MKKTTVFLIIACLLLAGYIIFQKCFEAKESREQKKREQVYQKDSVLHEQQLKERDQEILTARQENEALQTQNQEKEKTVKERNQRIKTLQSQTAKQLRTEQASREQILQEKEKDEEKIQEQGEQIKDLTLIKENQKIIIKNKDFIIERLHLSLSGERKLRLQLEENYSGLKKIKRGSLFGVYAGLSGHWNPFNETGSVGVGILVGFKLVEVDLFKLIKKLLSF